MSELKNCPFCGGEASVIEIPFAEPTKFVPCCNNRDCVAFYVGYGDDGLYRTEEEAVGAWNRRAE